jgi:hypothetical protein
MKRVGSKCGCPYCRGEAVPTSRAGWKARKNRHGRGYGAHAKGHGK